MERQAFLCKLHPDFHVPEDVDVGKGFDGDAYVRAVKDSHVDAVVFFAKCHYGHAYYHTQVGTRHPRLQKDMLADIAAACRRHGLGIIVYYSVFLDSAAVRKHPDWRLQDGKQNMGELGTTAFLPVCVNSPYADELLIPQALELICDYDVDELFYDTMSGFTPCYCGHCRAKFGKPVPTSRDDAIWEEYVRWYAAQYEAFFAKVARTVHEARSSVTVTFNWKWAYKEPSTPVPHIGRLGADLIPTGFVASQVCRYAAGTGYPFDYMCGRFLHGLGDWNNNVPDTIKYTAASTIAHGGSFYIIDRQLPDGRLERRAYDMMREVFGFIQERREWLTDAHHVPETAVLYSYASIMGDRLQFFPDGNVRKERMEPLEGASQMFTEHARHFTGLSRDGLNQRMGEYRLIVLPETEYLDAETRSRLADYVRRGGRLLITQAESEAGVYPDLLALAGVAWDGFAELDYGYFGKTGSEPIAVRGRFGMVRPVEGSDVLAPYVRPMAAGLGGKKFGHGFAPPAEADGHAVAVARKVGKGEAIYVAMPVFKGYWKWQNPYVADLMFGLMDRLLPDPLFRVSTRAQVETSAMRRGDDLILHLVNHSGKERLGGYYYPVTEYIPEIRDIPVAVRCERPLTSVISVPSGRKMKYGVNNGYAEFVIPRLHIMESVAVPGYFAPAGGKQP